MKAQPVNQVGQLFMIGLPGVDLDDSTRRLIKEYHINNFIYFRRNVENREQLRELSQSLYQACMESGLAPPIIAIDQEGGSVTRLPPPFTQFPDARVLSNAADPVRELSKYSTTCARELHEIGVNMNFAPVLDVCEAGRNLFMERRSLGGDPEQVAKFGCLIIKEMQNHGIAACGKHFPGLGAAVVDPHLELPVVTSPMQHIRAVDIVPFKEAVGAGVSSIMTSHTIYSQLDPHTPATLSKIILTDILRTELGYQGVIITDDLEMGAIEKQWSLEQAALKAFQAGADLLLICHDHDKVIKAYQLMEEAIKQDDDDITVKRINASVERLAALRQRFVTSH